MLSSESDTRAGYYKRFTPSVCVSIKPLPLAEKGVTTRFMRFLGATANEILFVALLVAFVLVAPRVAPFGERVGKYLSRGREGDARPPSAGAASDDDA